jgi:uncharacterized protein involved in outer membrane biogenesis
MKKILVWLLIILLAPVLLFLGTLTVVSLLGITVNLDVVRPMVEKGASAALDRQVKITGSVDLLPTLSPSLEVQGVRIENPQDWGSLDFIDLKLVRLQLGLLDLLQKKISIDEITMEGVSINLESRKNDLNNWSFSSPDRKREEKVTNAADSDSPKNSSGTIHFKAIDKISLKDIAIRYEDTVLGKTLSFQLNELSGEAASEKPVTLHATGSLQKQSYSFDLNAGALNSFRPQEQSWPLDLSGEFAGTVFSAKGDYGAKNQEQQLSLDVSIGAVDIGKLLSWLKVADDINASTEELALTLQLKGDSLHELVSQSGFTVSLKGGTWALGDPSDETAILINGLNGDIGASPGQPITLNLDGTIDTTPVNIAIQGMPLVNYISGPGKLPISISFAAAGAELNFSGSMDLPINNKAFTMAMALQGERLDSLNEFLRIDLPPFGPYSLKAQFAATDTGYDLSNLAIKVGSSDLTGSMNVNDVGDKPEVIVEFISNVLQLDDFALGDWSPEGKDEPEENKDNGEEQAPEEKTRKASDVPSLLSPEALARLNATLSIEMSKVLSGKDILGSGILHSSLQDGRFSIAPLQLDLADGTAKFEFSFYPTATLAEIHLGTTIEHLDLGILARRAKPESSMGGILNLDILLDSTAPSLSDLMANGKGHFDLAFAPVNFDAGVIDLWAVNLLSALASKVDGEPTSIINCLVASFAMEDGLMQERTIFIDTTHMSIEGEANINFKTEEIKVKVKPKAKRPEFFSLATPVKVKGTFEDFRIGINKIRLTTTVASFITSPIHVPLRRLFAGERPEDGAEACRAAWDNRNREKPAVHGRGD